MVWLVPLQVVSVWKALPFYHIWSVFLVCVSFFSVDWLPLKYLLSFLSLCPHHVPDCFLWIRFNFSFFCLSSLSLSVSLSTVLTFRLSFHCLSFTRLSLCLGVWRPQQSL